MKAQSSRATIMLKQPRVSLTYSSSRSSSDGARCRSGSSGSSSTPGLAVAAEELVKAACAHVETTSLSLGRDTVAGLTKIASHTSSIVTSIPSLKDSVATSIISLKDTDALSSKRHELGWAIDHADLNSFKYYEKEKRGYSSSAVSSTAFVKTVLISFRQGKGHYIKDRSLHEQSYSSYSNDKSEPEAGEQRFRDALASQISDLTGVQPRVEKASDGWAIYYS
jgi:hypothetical protein